jgi:para-nitrobenzyl esterase
VAGFPPAAIPGVIDGKVVRESIGTSLAGGRFAHVPILNGVNHDEERIFVDGLGLVVSGGTFVPVPKPVTSETYERAIVAVLGVSPARAAVVAAAYPLVAYASPDAALSALVGDANFACPALQVDRWTSRRVSTFAYQFDDDTAPQRFAPPGAVTPVATHSSELQYLFDLPNAPAPGTLNADQAALAAGMRAAWASFAASGDPSSGDLFWPSFRHRENVLSLVTPHPQIESGFSADHQCAFWAAG